LTNAVLSDKLEERANSPGKRRKDVPTMDLLQDITNFIFLENPPQKADIIFITGSKSPEPVRQAAALYRAGYAPYLCPSGKYSITKGYFDGPEDTARYPGPYRTECDFMTDAAIREGVPPECILGESEATYTMQNAQFSRELLDRLGIKVRRGILCCKSYHARRAYMYYQWAFPEAELLVSPADTGGISRENWYHTRSGIGTVLGELSRCGSQFPALIEEYAADLGKKYEKTP